MGEDPSQIREQIEETRAHMGDTVDALAYKADVKERAKDSVTDKKDRAMESVTNAKDRLVSTAPSTGDVKQGAQQAASVAQENPIGLAIGGVAVGFLVGMALPSSRVEDQRLGPVADQAKERAREVGQEAVERGKSVVQETAQTAADTAREKSQEQAREAVQA
jgi:ElaB/YqjD/DUF883 family membrane-anchored ribosome-binding protein